MIETNRADLFRRYRAALSKIGMLALLDLPEELKEKLKNTTDLKTKTELLEEIADRK